MISTVIQTPSWKSFQLKCWTPEQRQRSSKGTKHRLISPEQEDGINCEYLQQMLSGLESLSE